MSLQFHGHSLDHILINWKDVAFYLVGCWLPFGCKGGLCGLVYVQGKVLFLLF